MALEHSELAAALRGDVNALARHDIAFHRLMVESAGNVVLEQCWKSLGVEGRITISLYGTYVEPAEAAELHVPILEAIRSGKGPAAGRAARGHSCWKPFRRPPKGSRATAVGP